MKKVICLFAALVLLFCGCENSDINVSESDILEQKETVHMESDEVVTEADEKKKEETTERENAEMTAVTERVTEEIEQFEEKTEALTESSDEWMHDFDKESVVFDKKIALTFDDGPSIYTKEILDILDMYGCKATFFVVGSRIEKYEDVLKEIAGRRHEIGGHTWSHKRLTDTQSDEIECEINLTRDKIAEVTGKVCSIVRPPYGAWDDNLKETGERLGVAFVNWSIDTLDWKTRDAQSVYNEIIAAAADGKIILCHDLYESTVEAVKVAVPYLLSEGYEIVTVSEMFEENMEAGKIYYKK